MCSAFRLRFSRVALGSWYNTRLQSHLNASQAVRAIMGAALGHGESEAALEDDATA